MEDMLTVELFTTSTCNRCQKARHMLQRVIAEIDSPKIVYHEVDIVADIDYAVQTGVLSASAIAVNGELLYASIPSEKKLRETLQARLERASRL